MLQSSQPGNRNDFRFRRWLRLNRAPVRRVFPDSAVHTISVIIPDEILQDAPQMPLVECDDMVENLSPAASDPALGYAVLPGRLNARAFRFQTCGPQEANHADIEFSVTGPESHSDMDQPRAGRPGAAGSPTPHRDAP